MERNKHSAKLITKSVQTELIPVVAKQDDGHWYVIPSVLSETFNSSLRAAEVSEEANDQFIELFSQYMTGGDLNNIQLYARFKHEGNKSTPEQIEDIAALQARCDRYEKALKEIRYVHKSSDSSAAWQLNQAQNIAIQALSGEGKDEKEPDGGKILVCNNSDAFRYWTANIKGYRIAHKGHITVVWLPKGITSEMLAKEWGEYEYSNNLTNQKEG